MDRKILTEKLHLDVIATDEEILAKIEALMSAAPAENQEARSRGETIANAVAGYEAKGMTYDEAWAAAKKDPELKPVWEAMKKRG